MGQIINARSTYGRLGREQKTLSLPGDSDTPAEIDLNENQLTAQIFVIFTEDVYVTIGEDAADGLSRIASDNSRTFFPEGHASLPIVGLSDKLYIRRSSGSAVADGLSYWFVEAD